jgi:hypothetical protein
LAKDKFANIPEELRALDQWVVWNADKRPHNPLTGKPASISDPSTWTTFNKACQAATMRGFSGIGFVFTKDDIYAGIDLDKVINDKEVIRPDAKEIIGKLDSYTEVSQSGRGVHIIVRGKKPNGRCRKDWVEIYDQGRYFAMTGDVMGKRKEIRDRQNQLEDLVSEVFEEEDGGEDLPTSDVGDLTLKSSAEPPKDRMEDLRQKKNFLKLWEYKREDLKSLSDYDIALAGIAARDNWTDQEIADLIIAFRRKNGTEKDLKKALRQDYIKRTIARVRAKESNLCKLLPFSINHVIQYGKADSEWVLVLDGGEQINLGETASYVSSRIVDQKIIEAGYILSKQAVRRWRDIVAELHKSGKVRLVDTTTRQETIRSWLMEYIGNKFIPTFKDDRNGDEIFTSGNDIARDEEGRIFVRLPSVTRYARAHIGYGVSIKSVARDLASVGFDKRTISLIDRDSRGRGKRLFVWASPVGFMSEADEMGDPGTRKTTREQREEEIAEEDRPQ